MKCFVATAFGRTDVDAVYDRCVRPVLKGLCVQPSRVDRVEHNEDIDNKIFELLDSADFAIVDLTYARPSVYYEAGYASGTGKPVIYIARSDHFRARDADPDGLLRVHFDLQMKNIVSWSEPNDAFSKRLDKRLRHVLKLLLSQREQEEIFQKERSRFVALPQDSKLELLAAKAAALLRSRSFSIQARTKPTVLASRTSEREQQKVMVVCTPSALKRMFDGIKFRSSLASASSRGRLPERMHYVVVSLRSVPRSRVTESLSSFESLDDGTLYRGYHSGDRPDAAVFVHVLGGVRSESEFTDSFRTVLGQHGLEKGA